jgi:hypothetical protein|tara:strand:- start:682 stop:1650 length:969 start_codon:yes stop_codon:yes gene_type:complete
MSDEQTTTDSTEVDNSDIISRLTAVLESDDQTEEPSNEEEVVDEATDEVIEEDQELDPDEELTEEVEEDPTEENLEEGEETPELITEGMIEIDGETLSVEEIKLGYLRQGDYTKKTQAVAEQRKAAEDQTKSYESTLSALLTASGADLSRFDNVNWEQAAVENPDQYKQAKAMYEQTQQTFNFIKSQADEHQQRVQDQQQAMVKERATESLTVLKSTIPNWNNDVYYSIGEYAKDTLGVSSEEFNGITDHRSITAMYKAMQFDRAKTETQKKVKASPKKTLSGKKAEPADLGKKETYRKARDRLKKSGRMEDAVQALLNRTS